MTRTAVDLLSQQLNVWLPAGTEHLCAQWLVSQHTDVHIVRPRKTKLGDFRPQLLPNHHRISLNADLVPIQCLVTLVHEIAHAFIWNRYRNRVPSHGYEWKRCYQQLLADILALNLFDPRTSAALYEHMRRPKARSSVTCPVQKLIQPVYKGLVLNDLTPNQMFSLPSGQCFKVVKKLRTHWHCKELSTGQDYRVHGLAPVTLLPSAQNEKDRCDQ